MKGASASILSPAAELATRGMDSADEEPELPSAVQDLVRRLEGKGVPIMRLPELFQGEFLEFFPESESLSTITRWRSQVRLRVLEAIGSCNTLEHLDVGDMCGGDISRLTESDWEVVFRGFKSSTVLKTIFLDGLEWSSDAEVESLCSQIGRILNTSSVRLLDIQSKLSARCWLSLASGLRGNPDSKLQHLRLCDAWEDASAVKHVADMINSAPLLKWLAIACKDDMEKEAVGILSQALIRSSSLEGLILEKMKWGKALLLRALVFGNRSIEHLGLEEMDGLGGCVRELLTSNPSLKDVNLVNLRMSPDEWRQLGKLIRDRYRATNIVVRFSVEHNLRDEWESIEALATAASSDVKDPTLELQLVQAGDDELMLSLDLLGRVLRGEIKSLKSFTISARHPGTSGTTQDRPERFLSMKGKTGETSVLKNLRLYVVNEDVWKGLWKDLLLCLRGNTSLTHLDLSPNEIRGESFRYLDEEAFQDLMALLQVNLTLQEINVSNTSWATHGKERLIQEAVEQNQERAANVCYSERAEERMEGAGASNVSHAAETRGMDSAGEEPELPSAVQDLIRRLEGQPITWLPHLWLEEFPEFFQQTRPPKRLYVTYDVNIFHRINAMMHAGITVRFHFMCEGAHGFHRVKDQEGLKIRVYQRNGRVILKPIEYLFKLMYYAAKSATLGLIVIPDWVDLKSGIVKLDGISDRDLTAILQGVESTDLQAAWLRIQKILAPQLRDNYSSIFKLYQVKYARLEPVFVIRTPSLSKLMLWVTSGDVLISQLELTVNRLFERCFMWFLCLREYMLTGRKEF
ncbi:hypothetical protein AXG93_3228s1320 [Marchantia polymorpha subsp. ruderalis]|uniref:Uncharacterized protein n=1 Tax=Marchantia polymorpha subsp. ruderalis TaxID=1480154 RepID=A0A176WJT7_MARPO|nr:hypothetical protein AXG93_3228s1320 [Marchantia polymorpha subsp. ruderalis]